MNITKRTSFISFAFTLILIGLTFATQDVLAQATHQDIYEHHHWDHTGIDILPR